MSEAESFLNLAKDNYQWLHKANALFISAETLYNESVGIFNQLSKVTDTIDGHNERLQKSLDHFMSSKLLYGYALETLLKGILIKNKPERVEFDLKSDGSGNILEARIVQIGVPMSKGHDLNLLANEVGLIELMSNRKEVKQTLQHLTESVQWRSRYPTPQDSKKNFNLTSQQMTDFMWFKFRDFYLAIYEKALELLNESSVKTVV